MNNLRDKSLEILDYNLEDKPKIGFMIIRTQEASPVRVETPSGEQEYRSTLTISITAYKKS